MSKLGIETKQLSLNQNMSMLNSYQYTSFSLSFKNLNKNIFPSGPVPITILAGMDSMANVTSVNDLSLLTNVVWCDVPIHTFNVLITYSKANGIFKILY